MKRVSIGIQKRTQMRSPWGLVKLYNSPNGWVRRLVWSNSPVRSNSPVLLVRWFVRSNLSFNGTLMRSFGNAVNFILRKLYINILTCFTLRTMFHKTLSSLILRKLFRKMLSSFNFMKVIPQNVMSLVLQLFHKMLLSFILRKLFGRSTTVGDCVTDLLCFLFLE